jgi:hypothetical protein
LEKHEAIDLAPVNGAGAGRLFAPLPLTDRLTIADVAG